MAFALGDRCVRTVSVFGGDGVLLLLEAGLGDGDGDGLGLLLCFFLLDFGAGRRSLM